MRRDTGDAVSGLSAGVYSVRDVLMRCTPDRAAEYRAHILSVSVWDVGPSAATHPCPWPDQYVPYTVHGNSFGHPRLPVVVNSGVVRPLVEDFGFAMRTAPRAAAMVHTRAASRMLNSAGEGLNADRRTNPVLSDHLSHCLYGLFRYTNVPQERYMP